MSVRQEDGKYLIEGVLLVAEGPNISGRKYDIDSLKKAVKEYNEKDPASRLGEVHSGFTMDDMNNYQLNFDNVSHRVGDLTIDDDGTVIASCELLDTPRGKMVKDIIEGNVRAGVSSRALPFKPTPVMSGLLDNDGNVYDLNFIRVDVVPEELIPNADETED